MKGQSVLNAVFLYEDDGKTLEWIQQIDRDLTLSGRHTYLYIPSDGEAVENVVEHLNAAGVIVLLALKENRKDRAAIQKALSEKETFYFEPEIQNAQDVLKTAQQIRKRTVYDPVIEIGGSHI